MGPTGRGGAGRTVARWPLPWRLCTPCLTSASASCEPSGRPPAAAYTSSFTPAATMSACAPVADQGLGPAASPVRLPRAHERTRLRSGAGRRLELARAPSPPRRTASWVRAPPGGRSGRALQRARARVLLTGHTWQPTPRVWTKPPSVVGAGRHELDAARLQPRAPAAAPARTRARARGRRRASREAQGPAGAGSGRRAGGMARAGGRRGRRGGGPGGARHALLEERGQLRGHGRLAVRVPDALVGEQARDREEARVRLVQVRRPGGRGRIAAVVPLALVVPLVVRACRSRLLGQFSGLNDHVKPMRLASCWSAQPCDGDRSQVGKRVPPFLTPIRSTRRLGPAVRGQRPSALRMLPSSRLSVACALQPQCAAPRRWTGAKHDLRSLALATDGCRVACKVCKLLPGERLIPNQRTSTAEYRAAVEWRALETLSCAGPIRRHPRRWRRRRSASKPPRYPRARACPVRGVVAVVDAGRPVVLAAVRAARAGAVVVVRLQLAQALLLVQLPLQLGQLRIAVLHVGLHVPQPAARALRDWETLCSLR